MMMLKRRILPVLWGAVYSDPKDDRIEPTFGLKWEPFMRVIYKRGWNPVHDQVNDQVVLIAVRRVLDRINE